MKFETIKVVAHNVKSKWLCANKNNNIFFKKKLFSTIRKKSTYSTGNVGTIVVVDNIVDVAVGVVIVVVVIVVIVVVVVVVSVSAVAAVVVDALVVSGVVSVVARCVAPSDATRAANTAFRCVDDNRRRTEFIEFCVSELLRNFDAPTYDNRRRTELIEFLCFKKLFRNFDSI